MREQIVLTESRPAELRLSDDQARSLAELGGRLAGTASWWGAGPDEEPSASAISVQRAENRQWRVRINDAIGLITVPGLVISVQPKIPIIHAVELLTRGGAIPRVKPETVEHERSDAFWDLLVRWFLTAVEDVVRHDLIRDYQATVESLQTIRGRVDMPRTATNILQGRLAVVCEFEDFSVDTAANRLLLAGLRQILGCPTLTAEQRLRARRLTTRFDDVSSFEPADHLRAVPDRRMSHYADALEFAKIILRGSTPNLTAGEQHGWAFLLRTPEPIEAGIRRLLGERLAPEHTVGKGRLHLEGSTKTLNPDLVFDAGDAIGDVKYKLATTEWNNADLYQLVAFATGYKVQRALLLSFSQVPIEMTPLQVGPVTVWHATWDVGRRNFHQAADEIVEEVGRFLDR